MLIIPEVLDRTDNIHLDHLTEFFQGQHVALSSDANVRFLFLCFTNRCGSNFFAELLASTSVINTAEEFFNAGTIIDNCNERLLASLAEYVDFLISTRSGRGILAAKISIEQLVVMAKFGILESIISRSRFIIIERNDKLSQAISLDLAYQTGRWSTKQETINQDLVFDRRKISRLISYIVEQNGLLDLFLASNGIIPMRLLYEAIIKHPQHYVDEVLEMLNIAHVPIDLNQISVEKQANKWNREWRRRYLEGNM